MEEEGEVRNQAAVRGELFLSTKATTIPTQMKRRKRLNASRG
jgi:hypothetical protein